MKTVVLLLAVILLLPSHTVVTRSQQPAPLASPTTPVEAAYVMSIGGGPLKGQFKRPHGIAVDEGGRVYVADTGYARVQVFDADGHFLHMWGTQGAGPGQFITGPSGIALDRTGRVYVTDSGNHRIQIFTRDGTFVSAWGSMGSGAGQLTLPGGIAIGDDGQVYVADRHDRIQVFTADGTFLRAWGSRGNADGQFTAPSSPGETGPGGIAVDHSGNVYVTDSLNHRVQVFTSTGTFLRKWGGIASPGGQFNTPSAIALGQRGGFLNTPVGIALDASGDVLVVSSGKQLTSGGFTVQKFSQAGEFLRRWGADGYGPAQFEEPEGVAIDPAGGYYVADTGNNRVQRFNKDGAFLTQWGSIGDGLLRGPTDVALDRAGNVYVVDARNARVQKFSPQGAFLATWGAPARTWAASIVGDDQFISPSRIAIDAADRVYVTDVVKRRTLVFKTDGRFVGVWSHTGDSGREFYRVIAFDSINNVYAADLNRVRKFSAEGGPLPFPSISAGAVAVDARDNVYVLESVGKGLERRLRVISPAGKEVVQSAPFASKAGGSLEIDGAGRMFTGEFPTCRVTVLNVAGTLLGQWGACGFGDGQFDDNGGMALDATGRVFVADYGNNRVQVFQVRETAKRP